MAVKSECPGVSSTPIQARCELHIFYIYMNDAMGKYIYLYLFKDKFHVSRLVQDRIISSLYLYSSPGSVPWI